MEPFVTLKEASVIMDTPINVLRILANDTKNVKTLHVPGKNIKYSLADLKTVSEKITAELKVPEGAQTLDSLRKQLIVTGNGALCLDVIYNVFLKAYDLSVLEYNDTADVRAYKKPKIRLESISELPMR